jgi:hypothetical protein
MDQMQVPCLPKKKWDLRERQRSNDYLVLVLVEQKISRKGTKVRGKIGIAAKDRRERKEKDSLNARFFFAFLAIFCGYLHNLLLLRERV